MQLRASTRGVWVLALLLAGLAAWTTVRETLRARPTPFGDFNYLQTGAECLVDACDPYDSAALNREAAARHENKPAIQPMTPVYPPSSLLLLTPFAGLGWPLAAYVFNGLAGLATAAACVLMAMWLRIRVWDAAAVMLVATMLCVPMASALEFANPGLLEAALVAVACLLWLGSRWVKFGWVLFGVSLGLKPQLAIGAVVVLLLKRETRAAAVKACALALLLLVSGVLAYRLRLGSFQFLATLHGVLALSAVPGGSADFGNKESFGFLNFQTVFGAIPGVGREVVNGLAWLTTAAFVAATAWIAMRRDALRRRPWTMIALAVSISLMPVYHRQYDRVIALVLVPAAMEMRPRLAWVYAVLVTLWIANDAVTEHVLRRWRYAPVNPVWEVVFCAVLLVSLWWMPHGTTTAEA